MKMQIKNTYVYHWNLRMNCEVFEDAFVFFDKSDESVVVVPFSVIRSFLADCIDRDVYEPISHTWECIDTMLKSN